jgi:hypothetical protein
MSNGFTEIEKDTAAAARKGIVPDVLIDTYGNKAPDAARFGKGTSTQQGAADAADASRARVPGQYDHKR